jgi:hypothetical protein
VTANSASGSKYYDVTAPNAWYASVINQEKVRNYSAVEVTADSITVTTRRSQQNGTDTPVDSIVDQVTLQREDVTPPVLTVPADGTAPLGSTVDPMDGVTAIDVRDGDLTTKVTVAGTVDTSVLGRVSTLTYTVADAAGNTATATRQVTITEGELVVGRAPALRGAARVGQPITADPGTWTPEPTTVAYQWLRDGAAITGATSASYTPAAADLGHALAARVTVQRADYADEVVVTAAVTVAAAVDPADAAGGGSGTAAGSAGGGGRGALATTGASVAGAFGLALALVVAGGLAVRARRRRAV